MAPAAAQESTTSPPPLPPAGPAPEGDRHDSFEATKDGSLMSNDPPDAAAGPKEGSSATSGDRSQVDVAIENGRGPIIVVGLKPASKSSKYHGVSKHRSSGKYEAYLWDNRCRLQGQARKGRQVYLGSYDSEEKAARAHDLATLKYCSPVSRIKLNFPVPDYEDELVAMKDLSREEFVAFLKRSSSSFSRGASAYRGVARGPKDGQWQARIGWVGEAKDIFIGTFKTEEEAAEAYDIAAIELRGPNAVTNFDIRNYCRIGFATIAGAGSGS